LTYPQCPLSPQEALELLQKVHSTPIKDYVVAQEEHKDGSLHLHAYLRYASRVSWSTRLWDISNYHGNYQQAKSWKAVLAYCKKGGNFISNISVEDAQAKKAARNSQLLLENPKQLIADGSIGLLQLPQLLKAKAAHSLLDAAITTDDVRGVWVTGLSGSGKSHFVRTRHQPHELFIKSQNKWWDGYSGEPFILLDDFDLQGLCLSHYLKIWADRWACTGEIKGATINLRHTTFYVTSQYLIDDLWSGDDNKEIRDALQRRFKLVTIHRTDELGDN